MSGSGGGNPGGVYRKQLESFVVFTRDSLARQEQECANLEKRVKDLEHSIVEKKKRIVKLEARLKEFGILD